VGASPADITIHYIGAADGNWTGIAQWQLGNVQWNNVANATGGVNGIFNTQNRSAWLFTNPGDPYILTNVRPDAPVLTCPEVCENSSGNIFSAAGTGATYTWTFPSNGTITNGQGTAQTTVDWTTGTGSVSVVATDASGCQSDPATCTPTVNPLPNAQFSYANAGTSAEFTDLTPNATNWDWTFGDGGTAIIENPTHEYPALGQYSVTLTVTDNNGCVNSTTQLIELLDQIVIPNIITPNGDGINDLFEITTGGITDYNLIIQNRWGEVVYTTTDPLKHWDGKSNGTMVSEGVYFYQLTLTNIKETLKFHGFVTVSH
jgi:gliding motility-associated-like protein